MIRTAILVLLVASLLELYSLLPAPRATETQAETSSWHTLRGVFHLAPTDFPSVAAQRRLLAQAVALEIDYIVVAAPPEWKPPEPFPIDGPVSVWTEPEFATKEGHVLALVSDESASPRKAEVERLLTSDLGGASAAIPAPLLVAAHPDDLQNGWRTLDRFPAAIEAVNLESQRRRWLADTPLRSLFSFAFGVLNEYVGVMRDGPYPSKNFLAFDTPRADGRLPVALLAQRAHGDVPWAEEERLPWPRSETNLMLGRTVAFYRAPTVAAPAERRRLLHRAIAEGRIAMHFPTIFPFRGNEWLLDCEAEQFRVGDAANVSDPRRCVFRVELPEGFPFAVRLRLFRNGTMVKEDRQVQRLRRLPVAGSGNYRLEVWAEPTSLFRLVMEEPVPYVFYNAIAVR